jgi:hypothetical protein
VLDLNNPATLVIINIVGVGILGILTAFGKWYGKHNHGGSGPPVSKDVIVPALTVADNQVIAEQIRTLRDANDRSRERERFEREIIDLARDYADIAREMLTLSRRQTEYLESAKHNLMRIEQNQNPPSPHRK